MDLIATVPMVFSRRAPRAPLARIRIPVVHILIPDLAEVTLTVEEAPVIAAAVLVAVLVVADAEAVIRI